MLDCKRGPARAGACSVPAIWGYGVDDHMSAACKIMSIPSSPPLPSPLPSCPQMDVTDFIAKGGPKRRPLQNPLAAEFGIYSEQALDDFIERHLPTFALVSRDKTRIIAQEVNFLLVSLFFFVSLLKYLKGSRRKTCLPLSRPSGVRWVRYASITSVLYLLFFMSHFNFVLIHVLFIYSCNT